MLAYFKGKSFVSRLIKWRTWGKYSHVAWIVDRDFQYIDLQGDEQLVEAGTIYESWHRKSKGAKRSGVRKGTAGDLHKPGTVVDLYAIEIDDAHYRELIQLLEACVANPDAGYDFRGVISGFSLRKAKAHSNSRLFCSEYMMRCLIAIRIRFLINIDTWQTAPMDMAHSPAQRFVGSWKTGVPWFRTSLPLPLKEGMR